ncbi:MAG: DedA family protein [Flavisolibacter sp.]|jgi:membrane-associated protein|nr:DedA family protein [Flavisolibacter sp.]
MDNLLHIFLLEGGGFIHRFIEWIINNGGLYLLIFIVFAETGLFIGFFLPGDSLLFAAGIYLDQLSDEFFGMIGGVVLLVIVASILGNLVGYWFGRKTGPLLYERKETWIFKRKHLIRATDFYHEYGKATIFLAKFLPILRTFAPIVAGIVKMHRPTFILYNVLGSIAWVCSMMLGGYFLQTWVQQKFDFSLKDHIETITIVIVLITTLPVIWKLFFAKKKVVPTENILNDSNS